MSRYCDVNKMAKAHPFTQLHQGLYMGSKRALDSRDAVIFDVFVSTASEIKPPRSLVGDFSSYHIPLDDSTWRFGDHPEEVAQLIDAASGIAELVRNGKNVLIFCNMGMNRSGLLSALTLMHLGYSWQEALATIRKRHGCTLSNQSFVDALPFAEHMMRLP